MSRRPIVCVPCNIIDFDGTKAQSVRDTYIRALVEISGCTPLLVPSLEDGIDAADLMSRVDGFLLTGARSHVSPAEYGEERSFSDDYIDIARDSTTLPLLKMAVEVDKPVIAICRGFQELNVAMGGTLNQQVHDTDGLMDHRGKEGQTTPERFAYRAHKVLRQNGGWFEKIGLPTEFTVNSIHEQGIANLAPGLTIEATAEDGLIEAISVPKKRFILGTQWHPEGDWQSNPTSKDIFSAFGAALRQ